MVIQGMPEAFMEASVGVASVKTFMEASVEASIEIASVEASIEIASVEASVEAPMTRAVSS